MKIDYGPPPQVGVKQLQYVGNVDGIGDDADYLGGTLHRLARPVGIAAVAVWVYAWQTKKPELKKQANAVGLAALLVDILFRPR